jgi:hypothetical protein
MLINTSTIIDKKMLYMMISWLVKPVSRIVFRFRASEHKFKVSSFIQLFGDCNQLLFVAKTKKNKIVGGYTPLSF